MDEREFASKILEDKRYLQEVCMHVPEDLLRELASKDKDAASSQGESDQISLGEFTGEYFASAAQAMGYAFDPDTLVAEINDASDSKGTFFKLRYVVRFAKALNKAGKKHGIKL